MSTEHPPVAVVGAGAVGLCTAYALLERGLDLTVYERGRPGAGQSGGESRIFRHAHDDPRQVRETVLSRRAYDEWSRRLGVEMVSSDGAVALGPVAERRLGVLLEEGVAARPIGPDELLGRLPALAAYDGPAVLDERGGSIRTTAVVGALVEALGDRVVPDEVLSLRPVGDEVEVRAGGSTRRFGRAVVAAGRGTPALARTLGVELPVEEGVHVRLTYAVRGPAPQVLATLQDSSGAFGEAGVYAAAVPGNGALGLGIGEDARVRPDGSVVDPDALAALADRATAYVRRALPGLDPDPVDVRHCWVTRLPWGEDGVAVWEAGPVLLPAGHNLWKQAPGLGRRLAAAAAGEPLAAALRPDARLGG